MLWENLPSESATVTAYWAAYPEVLERDNDESVMGAWSRSEMLLAALIDVLRLMVWQQSNRGRKKQTPAPEPLSRPGVVRKPAAKLMEPWQVEHLNGMLDAAGVHHD